MYLGAALLDKEVGATKDIQHRSSNARQTFSHQRIQEITGVNRASDEIRRRSRNLIRHIMKNTALWHWNGGQRGLGKRPGLPKTTWRRMVEDERRAAGWQSWMTVRALATNRNEWKDNVNALCA